MKQLGLRSHHNVLRMIYARVNMYNKCRAKLYHPLTENRTFPIPGSITQTFLLILEIHQRRLLRAILLAYCTIDRPHRYVQICQTYPLYHNALYWIASITHRHTLLKQTFSFDPSERLPQFSSNLGR